MAPKSSPALDTCATTWPSTALAISARLPAGSTQRSSARLCKIFAIGPPPDPYAAGLWGLRPPLTPRCRDLMIDRPIIQFKRLLDAPRTAGANHGHTFAR